MESVTRSMSATSDRKGAWVSPGDSRSPQAIKEQVMKKSWISLVSVCSVGFLAILAMSCEIATADDKTFGNGVLPDFLAQYDVNDDGIIDEEERQAIKEARAAARAERIAEFDIDGNGNLSPEEKALAKEAVRAEIEARRAEKFNEIAGEDGWISAAELATVPGLDGTSAARLAKLFQRLDADSSGGISLDEFTARLRDHRGDHGGGDEGRGPAPHGRR
jgi:hypothetical protein